MYLKSLLSESWLKVAHLLQEGSRFSPFAVHRGPMEGPNLKSQCTMTLHLRTGAVPRATYRHSDFADKFPFFDLSTTTKRFRPHQGGVAEKRRPLVDRPFRRGARETTMEKYINLMGE